MILASTMGCLGRGGLHTLSDPTKTGRFYKRDPLKQGSFAKETYKNRAHLQKNRESGEFVLFEATSLGGLPLSVLGTVPLHRGARLV